MGFLKKSQFSIFILIFFSFLSRYDPTFLVRELFDELKVPYQSGYRNLEIWRKKDLLEKPENGGGTNYNVKYKITPSWKNFYEEFRRKILDILLSD